MKNYLTQVPIPLARTGYDQDQRECSEILLEFYLLA